MKFVLIALVAVCAVAVQGEQAPELAPEVRYNINLFNGVLASFKGKAAQSLAALNNQVQNSCVEQALKELSAVEQTVGEQEQSVQDSVALLESIVKQCEADQDYTCLKQTEEIFNLGGVEAIFDVSRQVVAFFVPVVTELAKRCQ